MSVDLLRESQDGIRAKALLEDPAFDNAIAKVRQGIFDRWASSPIADVQGQHELRLMLKLLNDIMANIREVADTGKLATLQIEQEAEQQSRIAKLLQPFRRQHGRAGRHSGIL